MKIDLQIKIRNNPYYLKYLRENSYWYKELNRNSSSFSQFEEVVKKTYKLRPTDKISTALNTIETFQTILSSMK